MFVFCSFGGGGDIWFLCWSVVQAGLKLSYIVEDGHELLILLFP